MIKIPPNLGASKDKLNNGIFTRKRLRIQLKFRGEEEMQQHSLLVSDLLVIIPNHNDVVMNGHKLA